MSLLSKIVSKPNISKISLDFQGIILPVNMLNKTTFFDSTELDTNWIATHFGKGSVTFEEKSSKTTAGTKYTQNLTMRLPTNNHELAIKSYIFQSVKHIKISFSNGVEIAIGRNDYNQNKKPRVQTKFDSHYLVVEFYTESITPTGILWMNKSLQGLPEIIPLNFQSL